MNENDIEFIQKIAELSAKSDGIASKLDDIEKRLQRLEPLQNQDIRQDEKLNQILERLADGNKHFEKVDNRLDILERQEGKKATKILAAIGGCLLTIILSFLAAKVGLK